MTSPQTLAPASRQWRSWTIHERGLSVELPVCLIRGRHNGPRLVILANQHGQEVNGIQAVRDFCNGVNPDELRGSVVAIASMNPRAAMLRLQAWDEGDGVIKGEADAYGSAYNMNLLWPGKTGGLWAQRAIHDVWHEVIHQDGKPADLVIDIHCHEHQTAIYGSSRRNAELAVVSGIPFITAQDHRAQPLTMCTDQCEAVGIPALTFELGGQRVFNPQSIADGVRAIRNLATFAGLLQGRLELPKQTVVIEPWRKIESKDGKPAQDREDFHSTHAGLIVAHRKAYDRVVPGDLLCEVVSPSTGETLQTCRATRAGWMIVSQQYNPVCAAGDRIAGVAFFGRGFDPTPIAANMAWSDLNPWPVQDVDRWKYLAGVFEST